MRGDVPVGRLAGIKIGINWSVLLMAAISTGILALNWLPFYEPGKSDVVYWIAGGLGALLFFGSLLVHEMGHALVARDEGIGVRSVSLWALGGLARLESSPTEPGAEFRIAVAGPLGSAGCAALFLSLAYALPEGGLAGVTGSLFAWLGMVNVLLVGFNLLPAAPLDGGTILSALLWRTSGRRATGMAWAARVGVVVGALMVVVGIRSLHGRWGLWLLSVGPFVLIAAINNLRAAPLWEALDGVRVASTMEPAAPPVPASTPLTQFLTGLPRDTPHAAYPVSGTDGLLAGLLTVDAVRATPPLAWDNLRVGDLAYPPERLTIVRDDELLLPAVQKVESGEVPDGLVVDRRGTVVGILRSSAIHRAVEARRNAARRAGVPAADPAGGGMAVPR